MAKLILFIGVLFLVYWQVSKFDKDSWDSFKITNPLSFIVAIIFVFPNIWLAYYKWKTTLKLVAPSEKGKVIRQSFFAGVVTGMLTPNMVGNFIGRFYYFQRAQRIPIILFTLLSNYAQFLASLSFGWFAIIIVGKIYSIEPSKSLLVFLGAGVVFAYLIYFFIDNFLNRFKRKAYFIDFRDQLRKNRTFRSAILILSLLRFLVFTIQFSFILNSFGEDLSVQNVLAIWQVYLLTMLIPSMFFGKIGVRESVALFVLTGVGMNEFAVLFASLIIWFVNSLCPAIFGLVICKNDVKNA
ncbi:MAG: flippase-like domain-containing protein [Crocinitomicaceae bacterium]|nr:flippase-like domain-containing protein [Crocinitomicaceae bacterium]